MRDTAHNNESGQSRLTQMVRLTKSKRAVDLAPNTIRAYAKQGLNLYRVGKAVFFHVGELEAFIRKEAA
jgi:hypothetical protein